MPSFLTHGPLPIKIATIGLLLGSISLKADLIVDTLANAADPSGTTIASTGHTGLSSVSISGGPVTESFGPFSYSAQGAVNGNGSLSVSATANVIAQPSASGYLNTGYYSAAAGALANDYLTVFADGQNGKSGFVQFTETIVGATSATTAPGACLSVFGVPQGPCNARSYGDVRFLLEHDVLSPTNGVYQQSILLNGNHLTPDTSVTYLVPITFGEQFLLTRELFGFAYVEAATNPGEAAADVFAGVENYTTQISGIQVFDDFATPIDFQIQAASGLDYTANGLLDSTGDPVSTAPEPASLALLGLGVIGGFTFKRKRR